MSTAAYDISILGCTISVSGNSLVLDEGSVLAGHGATLAVGSGFAISNGPVHIYGDDDDSVVRKYVLRTQTSDNEVSPFRLDWPNGLSGLPLREEHTYLFNATIVGKTQGSNISFDCAAFKMQGLVVDDALGLEVVDPYTVTNVHRISSSIGVSATGVVQGDDELLQINVTGINGKDINWVAAVDVVELGGTTTNPFGIGRSTMHTYSNYLSSNYCVILRQPNNFVDSSGDPSFFCSGITNSGYVKYQWEYRYNGDPDEETDFVTYVGATGLTFEPPAVAPFFLSVKTDAPHNHSTAYPNEFRCVIYSNELGPAQKAISRPVSWH